MRLKQISILVMVGMALATAALAAEPLHVPFKGDIGALPKDFSALSGAWQIVKAEGGKTVMQQTGEAGDAEFNVAVYDGGAFYGDVDLSVRVRSLSGREDQGGGLIWRYRDKDNYYIARFNPLEDNYRVYKVINGHRKMLKSAALHAPDGWHSLRVTMKGDNIACYFDGKAYLQASDNSFPQAGKIGLWTKADAKTQFDDLTLEQGGQ